MKYSALILLFIGLLSWSCSGTKKGEPAYNVKASLPASFKFNQMGLKVITSSVNTKNHTMSTCYGNDIAVNTARAGGQANYPAGAVITLVTWNQQEDQNWFGGNIPAEIKSVEMVKRSASADLAGNSTYQKFTGKDLREAPSAEIMDSKDRINYILGLRAAVMP